MCTLCAVLLSIVIVVLNGHPLPHESNLVFLMNDDEHAFIFGQKAANNEDLLGNVQYELSEANLVTSYTLETIVTLHTSDESFMVLLSPRRNLISSNLRLISSDDDDQDTSSVDWRECLWQGTVLSHADAVAAFSNCDNQGLRGVIVTRDAQYFVHPVPKRLRGRRELPQSVSAKLIVFSIQKMTLASGNQGFCSVPSAVDDYHEIVKRETAGGSSASVKVIETAVFVDSELQVWAAKQAETNSKLAITELVFALMNSVQAIFDHPSMEVKFKFVLVHLEFIDDPNNAPAKSNGRITEYLNSFCIWQNDDKRGNRNWDHAILLSGLDLYAKEPSDSKAMGMAWVSGMCRKTLSCTINEGNTFQSVYVISHEIGHNLGMQHDGNENDCDPNLYIMSATLGPGRTQWSSCSNKYVSTFLQRPQASCLNNEATPPAELDFARSKFPGQMFPADQQCIIAYGETYHPFVDPEQPPYDDICRVLWCANETHAQSTLRTLDGTVCDANKVCMYGACVGLDTLMTSPASTTASATPMQCTCPSQHSGTDMSMSTTTTTTTTLDHVISYAPSSEANTSPSSSTATTTPQTTNPGASPSSIATTPQASNQGTSSGTSTLATVLTGTTPLSTPPAAPSPATTSGTIEATSSTQTTAFTLDHSSTLTTVGPTTPASVSSGTTLDHSSMLTTGILSTAVTQQSSVAASAAETMTTVVTSSSVTVPTTIASTLEHPNTNTGYSTALTSDSTFASSPTLTTIVLSTTATLQSASATSPIETTTTPVQTTSASSSIPSESTMQTTSATTLDHPRTETALTSASTSASGSTWTTAISATATSQTATETTTWTTTSVESVKTTPISSTTFTTPVSLMTTTRPSKARTTPSNSPIDMILDKMDERAQERLDQQVGPIDFDPDVFLALQEYPDVEAVPMRPHEAPLASWTQQRSHCSKTCGTGERNVEYACLDNVGTPSNHCLESLKPQNHTESCNTHTCATLEWHVQGWTECNVTCGDGFQSLVSVCVVPLDASNYDVVPDENCFEQKTLKRPPMDELRACSKTCKDNA